MRIYHLITVSMNNKQGQFEHNTVTRSERYTSTAAWSARWRSRWLDLHLCPCVSRLAYYHGCGQYRYDCSWFGTS